MCIKIHRYWCLPRTYDGPPALFCLPTRFRITGFDTVIPADPSEKFYYVCDAFEEKELDVHIGKSISSDTVYFDLGSSTVDSFYTSLLDGIPEKLRTSQDLVVLYASTDKSGQDNRTLGAARNEAIKQELIQRGVKEANIILVNFGDTQAKHYKAREDRHVIIATNVGKMYQKLYSQALEAAQTDDYKKANALIKKWLELVPQEYAIYAMFDCWGVGKRANFFKNQLTKRIRSKYFYRNNRPKFLFDSMYAAFHYPMLDFASNHLPTSNHICQRDMRQSNIDYDDYALQTYAE